MIRIILALLVSAGSLLAAQTNYVMNLGGSDSNPGTAASPWQTYAKGINSINSGTTTDLVVSNGTYSGNQIMTASGSASHPITITAWNTNNPLVNIVGVAGGNTMQVNEASNWFFRGLTFSNVFTSSRINLAAFGHNAMYGGITIRECKMANAGHGIYFEAGTTSGKGFTGVNIISNDIHDLQLTGIYLRNGESFGANGPSIGNFNVNFNITGNSITNITGTNGLNTLAEGILAQCCVNCTTYGNLVKWIGNSATASPVGGGGPAGILYAFSTGGYVGWNAVGHVRWNGHIDGIGLNPGPAVQNSLWEHNYVWDCDGAGYLANYQFKPFGGTNTCRWNTFVNTGKTQQSGYTDQGFVSSSFPLYDRVYQNTFVSLNSGAKGSVFQTGDNGPSFQLNNIFITTSGDLDNWFTSSGTPQVTANGNLYWDLDGSAQYNWQSVNKNGIAAWRTASSQDALSTEANPSLRNASIAFEMTNVAEMLTFTNYQLPSGSPYLAAGLDLTHAPYNISSPGAFDANSNAINGVFPIGAFGGTPPDPVITQQPQSVQVYVNQSTNFMVVASGSGTLHYQWKVNGVNQGTDSATFTTNTVLNGANGASVTVVITGSGPNSPVTSSAAFIQVLPDPYITGQPQNVTTAEGGSATFNVVAQGATTLSYAWTVGGVSQGGNSPTLVLNNVPFLFNGSAVVCAVTDSNGTTNSAAAILTVNHNGPPPPYTGDPVNFTLVSALRTNGVGPVQGWIDYDVSFYPLTELNTNFDSARAFGQIAWFLFPVANGQALGPQTYKIYIGQATQTTNSTVIANIGDGWVTNTFGATDAVNTWTNLPNVTTSISFSNVLIGVMKRNPAGLLQNYWLAGVGVLQTNYDVISPGLYRFIDTNSITTTNLAGAPGNLIPNSSFELGFSPGGWINGGRNGTIGNEVWLNNMLTNDAFNGTNAVAIGSGYGAARFQLNSPPIWLRGDRNIRSYVLSFYYKKGPGGPASATIDWSRPYSGNDSGSANFSPTTAYQRFQTNLWLSPYPNRLFGFVIHHVATGPLMIDAVQFEESTNGATAYAPADQVEVAIAQPQTGGAVQSRFNGDVQDANGSSPAGITIIAYNNTANTSNVLVHISTYDWMNRWTALNATYIMNATPGTSTKGILWRPPNGYNRYYAYADGSPAFQAETATSFIPIPAAGNSTTNWNSMFGTHACEGTSLVASNLAWGVSWQRGLSPGGIIQWNEIEPTIGGGMDFTSTIAKLAALNGQCVILANISDVSDIPAWALTNGIPMLDRLSNFVHTSVSTLKPYVHFWESINEPMTPSGWSASQFAPIETTIVGAVKAADPTAKYVGFGGIGNGTDISGAETAWGLMNANTHNQIDYVSTHMYPANSALWMSPDDDPRPAAARALGIFCGKPVWNTESSSFMWPNHGDKNGGLQGLPSYANHNEEFNYRRSVWQAAELASRNWIRLLGYGIQKYFYYDGRLAGGRYDTEDSQSYWFDFDDSLNPIGAAYFWSIHFLDYASYVQPMTNTASSDASGYLFAHTNGPQVIAVFTLSRSNLLMTVTNNNFATYDLMGNLVGTNQSAIAIGRRPSYWVSSDLSSNQLQATFESASVAPRADVIAPAVSIDVSQHGNILDTNQLPFRFRWTAIDNYNVNTDDTPSIVTTRYRFAGLTDWSAWTADRYVEMTNAPSILTHLEVQAMDVFGNTSEVISGPNFGPSAGPLGPFNFHISKGHVSKGHL